MADALHHVKAGENNSSSNSDDTHEGNAQKLVAAPRTEALKEKPVRSDNNLHLFEKEWDDHPRNAEICKACRVRPVGYPHRDLQLELKEHLSNWATQEKAEQRKICRICLNRQDRRSEQWIKDTIEQNSPQNTIWTDEVADDNGRLALLSVS
ncbi:hypothetical protein HC928_11535 [bacterium]|nr:hypothetical protein [bacterium]